MSFGQALFEYICYEGSTGRLHLYKVIGNTKCFVWILGCSLDQICVWIVAFYRSDTLHLYALDSGPFNNDTEEEQESDEKRIFSYFWSSCVISNAHLYRVFEESNAVMQPLLYTTYSIFLGVFF
jgi:hypothetical protein